MLVRGAESRCQPPGSRRPLLCLRDARPATGAVLVGGCQSALPRTAYRASATRVPSAPRECCAVPRRARDTTTGGVCRHMLCREPGRPGRGTKGCLLVVRGIER